MSAAAVQSAVLEFVVGDITNQRVDAIVNAANTALKLGSGVAGAIKHAGGPTIQQECDVIGPIALGEAAVTYAGDMAAVFVIHATAMHWGGSVDPFVCAAATRKALERANDRNVQSIAFPAIGAGVGGLTVLWSARAMLSAIHHYLVQETTVKRIVFVLIDEETRATFAKAWEEIHP